MRFYKFKGIAIALILALVSMWTGPAQAAITFTISGNVGPYSVGGSSKMATGKMDLAGTYATGGFTLNPRLFGMRTIQQVIVQAEDGYDFFYNASTGKIMVFQGSSSTPAGTVSAPTFTGTAPTADLNYGTPAFSGTGQSSSGQVITTTDNQTMTLNQCTGMWFVSAEHGPYLIASNTAVTGAPAVLTVYGTAPTTDAGTYKILKALTPVGTNSAPTFTGTSGGGGAASEIADTTSLASVDLVNYVVIGN